MCRGAEDVRSRVTWGYARGTDGGARDGRSEEERERLFVVRESRDVNRDHRVVWKENPGRLEQDKFERAGSWQKRRQRDDGDAENDDGATTAGHGW